MGANKFCKVSGYEVNTKKSDIFLSTSNELSETEISKTDQWLSGVRNRGKDMRDNL
jgi:hypothetical protein